VLFNLISYAVCSTSDEKITFYDPNSFEAVGQIFGFNSTPIVLGSAGIDDTACHR
jgi:hypothetical protein